MGGGGGANIIQKVVVPNGIRILQEFLSIGISIVLKIYKLRLLSFWNSFVLPFQNSFENRVKGLLSNIFDRPIRFDRICLTMIFLFER